MSMLQNTAAIFYWFMNLHNMIYSSAVATFKIECEVFFSVKDKVKPKVLKINNRDHGPKIIRWSPIFKDCLDSSQGSLGPLNHVPREDPVVPDETMVFLLANCCH